MDPRQQSHEYGEGSAQRTGGNYAFNGTQNDVFNTFVHTDNESAFDSSWNSQAFPAQQQPINGFDQGHQAWQQNAYQNSNLLPINNFGAQSRDYDQTFSRTPAPFNYAGFDSNANPTFSPPAYANTLNYGQLPLNNGTPYGYTGNQGFQEHNETISPQALQHYPFPVTAADEGHQVCALNP